MRYKAKKLGHEGFIVGTTCLAAKELNRKFIGCDLNPKAIEITKARLNGSQ